MKSALRAGLRIWVVIALAGGGAALGADWPNWRGPNYDGISLEKGFMTKWTQPPKVLWEYPVGSGFSSFTGVGGRVFTCGTKDKQQVLFCFDAATGKVIWERAVEKEYREKQGGDGTRATPTVHEGRVYQLGGIATLACFDAKDGKEIWKRQLGNQPHWGYSGSVLIEGNLAIVSAGGSDGALLALDAKTGQQVWKCASDPAGYSTPHAFTLQGNRYVVGFLAQCAIIAEVKTGREMWRVPWKTDWDVNASTPVYHDGYLLLCSGYGTGGALFKLSASDGKLSGEPVWQSKVLTTKFRTPVLKDGFLYTSTQDRDGLRCIEFLTGRLCWSVPDTSHASVLLAGEHLIVLTENGRLMIAKMSPERFEPAATADVLSGRCWTVPTLYDGRLYLRNLKTAVCLELTGERASK